MQSIPVSSAHTTSRESRSNFGRFQKSRESKKEILDSLEDAELTNNELLLSHQAEIKEEEEEIGDFKGLPGLIRSNSEC